MTPPVLSAQFRADGQRVVTASSLGWTRPFGLEFFERPGVLNISPDSQIQPHYYACFSPRMPRCPPISFVTQRAGISLPNYAS